MERTCSNCKATFQIEKKRGRPHTKCESCRGAKWTGPAKTASPQTKITTPSAQPADKPKRKFKDEPGKGNPRYSRQAFIQYMEEFGVPLGSQAVAQAIKAVDEMVKERRIGNDYR